MPLTDAEKLALITRTWNLEETGGKVPFVIEIGHPHHATTEYYNDDAAELAWHDDYHCKSWSLPSRSEYAVRM